MASNQHIGSDLDDLLADDGLLEDVSAEALKRAIVRQLERAMAASGVTKAELAARLGTSRSQLDRLLDENTAGLTLHSLSRLAGALGLGVGVVLEPRSDYAFDRTSGDAPPVLATPRRRAKGTGALRRGKAEPKKKRRARV